LSSLYHKIMVPVDLAHLSGLAKALRTAADLAAGYRMPVCYVSVAPGPAPLTAERADEFREALMRALEESGADLVVMASRIPNVDERLFASNAAFVAASATVTVMVVR